MNCICKNGEIYDAGSNQICPQKKPNCNINCLHFCNIQNKSDECLFNCKKSHLITSKFGPNSKISCKCAQFYSETNSGCKGNIQVEDCGKNLNFGNLDCDSADKGSDGCDKNCSILRGFYCIHYGYKVPYTDKCYLNDEIENDKKYTIFLSENLIVIHADYVLKYDHSLPFLFSLNSSGNAISIPLNYIKNTLNLSSLIIQIKETNDIYCSRNLIVDLHPLKLTNKDFIRIRNTNISLPLKPFTRNCNVQIPTYYFVIYYLAKIKYTKIVHYLLLDLHVFAYFF